MAKKITAYSCQYGCRRNVLTSKKRMEEHEERCFYNPKRRACVSCKHFDSYKDDNGMDDPYRQEWRANVCDMDIDLSDKLTSECDKYEELVVN